MVVMLPVHLNMGGWWAVINIISLIIYLIKLHLVHCQTYVSLLQNLLVTVVTSSSLSSKMNILDAHVIKKSRVYF